jgi:hypothetical protein
MPSSQSSGRLRPATTAEPVALDVPPAWTPTSDNINRLPEPLRRYIHDLEAVCDPAGDVAEMFRLREENKALRWECERLAAKAGEGEGQSHDSPSLVPEGFDIDIYVVMEDYGNIGRAYREVDEEKGDRATLIRHLIEGQYDHPVRIVAFNTAQGWSRDVSTEIAREMVQRARAQGDELTGPVRQFVDWELERAERRSRLFA